MQTSIWELKKEGQKLKDLLTRLSRRERIKILNDEALFIYSWFIEGRAKQIIPDGDWETWLINAGRGFGKTRTGAETVKLWKEFYPIIHLVGATASDIRDVMVEGPSGILSVCDPIDGAKYEPSKRRVTFDNGSKLLLFSADEPNRLRGPQCYKAWADELAAWRYPDAWDQLQFGLRLGDKPQCIVTTTPRPTPIIKGLIKEESTYITTGSSYENKTNLSESFFNKILKKYEGTTLGRQEIYAEVLQDVEGALWVQSTIDNSRVQRHPELVRIVVALDPSASDKADSDEAGLVVAGIGTDKDYYVLADESAILSPNDQSLRAIKLYNEMQLDAIIYEKNNGGDWIPTVIRGLDPRANTKEVWASRGKRTRAEPIASLYEQGRVHHVGILPKLENEMVTWVPQEGRSPNRIDALVWAITELMTPPKKKRRAYAMRA